jgi:two-component system, OmpR family, sensor histidine kinase SenX3
MTTMVVAVVALAAGAALAAALLRRSSSARDNGAAVASERQQTVVRLTGVLDGLSTGVVLCDDSGTVTFRNAAAQAMAGTHLGVLVDETIERHLAAGIQGKSSEEQVDLLGPPKMVFVVRAIPAANGGACAFVDDISERRRIDAVRTDFVANISHELKTPVGALAVLAETLVDETDQSIVARLADRMLEEAHRAVRTIDDLLELSQIELGEVADHENLSANDIVHRAIERVEALAEQRSIEIRVSTTAAVNVRGDRRQLISAVGNLVENAVKYSEQSGRVELQVRLHEPWVEFVVDDQGVGIPSRDLDRIFERFYRVDKARSRGTGGSGLGLSIVRHVAANHGGDVLVSSTEGEGSTFVLRVPLDDSHRAVTSAVTSAATSASSPAPTGQGAS